MNPLYLKQAIEACESGGVIAYPTEAVFGLGCLPMNEASVNRILDLKQRSVDKGLILVAANIQQLEDYVDFEKLANPESIFKSWPGPVTWLIPAKPDTPPWLTGEHSTLAVRVTAHTLVIELCKRLGPIVSTSANPQGSEPARSSEAVEAYFKRELDYIIPAKITEKSNPTEIRDGLSGDIIRIS